MSVVGYWLSETPSIVGFRWNHAQSWGSTWSFVLSSIVLYFLLSLFLYLILYIFNRQTPIPLGPIPAAHSLIMTLLSATIFLGILLSSAAEIRDTRWFFRRYNTNPFQWFFCFPIGTRPTGRVFFWSYAFYISRFVHLLRTFFLIMTRPNKGFPASRIFNRSALIFMTFLWLEFTQSFQVMAIMSTTLVYVVVYGYRFWIGIGLPAACFPMVFNCQIVLLAYNLLCHVGVLLLHLFSTGGCNGIGAWVFNSVLNAALLFLFDFSDGSHHTTNKKKRL